jgi:hypothetical protein
MPSTWITALKEWNQGKSTWCIPQKGSSEYNEVKAIMDRNKTPKPKTKKAKPKTKKAKPKTKKATKKLLGFVEAIAQTPPSQLPNIVYNYDRDMYNNLQTLIEKKANQSKPIYLNLML